MNLSRHLREGNRPQFLCSLFVPKPHRDAVIALYSFEFEVARVCEQVSDPLIGQMRLKWWYDAAQRVGTRDVPRHPVLLAVDRVFTDYQLDPAVLLSLVEAYAEDISRSQPNELKTLIYFLDRTQGDLNKLAIRVVGGETSEETVMAGYHVGRAWGLSRLLRNLPKLVSRGRVCIPDDICHRETVSKLDIMGLSREGPLNDGVIRAIRTVVGFAEDELSKGRDLKSFVERPNHTPLLSGILAGQVLAALKASDFDPRGLCCQALEPGPISMVKLWWSAQRGTY